MKRILLLIIGVLMLCQNSYAINYDFVAVSPSGHTLFYEIHANNTVWVVGPQGIQGDLIIPSQVSNNGTVYSVTYIAESAFSEVEANHGLTSVVIPNSVTTIYYRAFEDCRNLTSVSLPSSLVSIYMYAFAGAGIDTLNIPSSVTSINERAFQYCRNLSSITVDPGNTTYDSRNGCNALIKTSNNRLILGCSNTIIPNSVTQLGEYSFNLCEGLQSIVIPSSIITIPNNIFDRCINLRKVVVPSSVISIGSYAFYGCTHFDSLIMLSSTPPILSGTVFSSSVGVYVPCGSYQTYQNSWGINNYTFHEPESDLQLSLSENNSIYGSSNFIQHHGSNVSCLDSTSEITAVANYGYHFSQWSDGDTNNPRIVQLTSDTAIVAIFEPNQYIIQGVVYDTAMGYVSGNDTVDYLDTVTLTAVPKYGYSFSRWNDYTGYSWNPQYITDNPRQIIATGNMSFTAIFTLNTYLLTVNVDTNIHGNCTGSGNFLYLTNNTITATANYGYHFTHWSDGDTNNPRTITLTQDTSLTAYFANNQYAVIGIPNNSTYGTVSGSDTVDYLDTVVLTATANTNYYFSRWSDGITVNPRAIVASGNHTVTAYFNPVQFTLMVASCDTSMGRVSGGGNYNYLSSRTISAIANNGYHFTQWNDGVTSQTRTITLTQDTSFTAFFAPNQYTLTLLNANPDMGSVEGGGAYYYHDTVIISATAVEHHHFVQWSDGNRDNPRQYLITGDATLTANFAIDTHTVNISANDIARGSVSSTGTRFVYGTPCTVTATAYTGYTFVKWNNGVTANPYTFAVMNDMELTAIFLSPDEMCTVTAASANPSMGAATVDGGSSATVMSGEEVTLTATPFAGYRFVQWQDDDTHSHRTVTVTSTITYTAYFAPLASIRETEGDNNGFRVFAYDGQIVVEGAEGMPIMLYDATGRLLATRRNEDVLGSTPLRFDVPASGTYLIKVGNHPARKVVVIR